MDAPARIATDASPSETASWLAPEAQVERIDLGRGSWVDVVRGLVPRAQELHDDLLTSVQWQQSQVYR